MKGDPSRFTTSRGWCTETPGTSCSGSSRATASSRLRAYGEKSSSAQTKSAPASQSRSRRTTAGVPRRTISRPPRGRSEASSARRPPKRNPVRRAASLCDAPAKIAGSRMKTGITAPPCARHRCRAGLSRSRTSRRTHQIARFIPALQTSTLHDRVILCGAVAASCPPARSRTRLGCASRSTTVEPVRAAEVRPVCARELRPARPNRLARTQAMMVHQAVHNPCRTDRSVVFNVRQRSLGDFSDCSRSMFDVRVAALEPARLRR